MGWIFCLSSSQHSQSTALISHNKAYLAYKKTDAEQSAVVCKPVVSDLLVYVEVFNVTCSDFTKVWNSSFCQYKVSADICSGNALFVLVTQNLEKY